MTEQRVVGQEDGMTGHRVEGFLPPAEGELAKVSLPGCTVAVARVEGQLYAVDDACTHQQCSLSGGDVEDLTVVCPCHLGIFDLRTGEVLGGPPPTPLRTYRARLDGTALELDAPR